ncbi:MAG: hydroxymethylglutaryl-CoA lyase [Thermodesulfobacteriota bacterium]
MSISHFPTSVHLTEVGPRDGFQNESRILPTELKLRLIEGLVDAGLKTIQVASFVNPKKVPQMADSEEIARLLPQRTDVLFTGLVLNVRGMERAMDSGIPGIEVSVSASHTHSLRNAGMGIQEALEAVKTMIRMAKRRPSIHLRASIQCTFGCPGEPAPELDRLLDIAEGIFGEGVDMLCLADTTGMADPISMERTIDGFRKHFGDRSISLHLHDTRGLGLVNAYTALKLGIRHFDVSFGGIGGCPFVEGAAGNIATEDTLALLESLNIRSGVDPRRVALCSWALAEFLGKPLPGRMYRLYREHRERGQEHEHSCVTGPSTRCEFPA